MQLYNTFISIQIHIPPLREKTTHRLLTKAGAERSLNDRDPATAVRARPHDKIDIKFPQITSQLARMSVATAPYLDNGE